MASIFGGLLWLLTFSLPVALLSGAVAGILVLLRKRKDIRGDESQSASKAENIAVITFKRSAVIAAAGVSILLLMTLAAGLKLVKIEAF